MILIAKIQGLKENAFSSQSKYSKDLMNGAFMKNKDIHHIHRSSLSLSLSRCNFSFSRSLIFSLSRSLTHTIFLRLSQISRSLTHTIFLRLSQIFKANIILHFVAMKIKGGTEDCFPVFVFLFLISFFTLSHTNESYRHQASVACMR